ncbi:MAG: hypothetical protein F4X27_11345 [Chloroflexi bacterium]|nr:hypothetical protein [Chloroflexota bacterium]
MSLAQQVQAVNDGLFNRAHPPDQMVQVLDNGTQRVPNWRRVRLAVEALSGMSWYQLDPQWEYFLSRYPADQQLDLRPDEVGIFQNLVQNLVNQTREGMRILSSVQPEVSLTNVSVVVDADDLPGLAEAISHVQRTTELAAVGDAITIESLQPGSLEVILTAGKASLCALQLAIVLAKILKDPSMREKARSLKRLLQRAQPDADVEDETVFKAVQDEAMETFWDSAWDSLKETVEEAGQNPNEAKNKVDSAANEIYQNADRVSADWRLPPAVVSGLPGGLTVTLNYEDPELVGRVIRALAAPQEDEGTTR